MRGINNLTYYTELEIILDVLLGCQLRTSLWSWLIVSEAVFGTEC